MISLISLFFLIVIAQSSSLCSGDSDAWCDGDNRLPCAASQSVSAKGLASTAVLGTYIMTTFINSYAGASAVTSAFNPMVSTGLGVWKAFSTNSEANECGTEIMAWVAQYFVTLDDFNELVESVNKEFLTVTLQDYIYALDYARYQAQVDLDGGVDFTNPGEVEQYLHYLREVVMQSESTIDNVLNHALDDDVDLFAVQNIILVYVGDFIHVAFQALMEMYSYIPMCWSSADIHLDCSVKQFIGDVERFKGYVDTWMSKIETDIFPILLAERSDTSNVVEKDYVPANQPNVVCNSCWTSFQCYACWNSGQQDPNNLDSTNQGDAKCSYSGTMDPGTCRYTDNAFTGDGVTSYKNSETITHTGGGEYDTTFEETITQANKNKNCDPYNVAWCWSGTSSNCGKVSVSCLDNEPELLTECWGDYNDYFPADCGGTTKNELMAKLEMEYFTEIQGMFDDIFTIGENPDSCTTLTLHTEDATEISGFTEGTWGSGGCTGSAHGEGVLHGESDGNYVKYENVLPGKGMHYIDISYNARQSLVDEYLYISVNGVQQKLLFERTTTPVNCEWDTLTVMATFLKEANTVEFSTVSGEPSPYFGPFTIHTCGGYDTAGVELMLTSTNAKKPSVDISSGDTLHYEEEGLSDGENRLFLFDVDSKDGYFTVTAYDEQDDWMVSVIDNGQNFEIKCEQEWVNWACGESTEIEPQKCAQVQSGDLRDEHGCTQYEFYLPADTMYYESPSGSMSDVLENMVNAISTDMNQIDNMAGRQEFAADVLLATTSDGEGWFSSDQTRVSESTSSLLAKPIHFSVTEKWYEIKVDGWSPAVFKLRADTDKLEVELISGTFKKTEYLSTTDTEYTVPLDRRGSFQINNVNGGAVYFTSDTEFEIYNDELWGNGDNWNCGTGSEGYRCDTIRDGRLTWAYGLYHIMAPRESIDTEGLYYYTMNLNGKEQNQFNVAYTKHVGTVCVTEEDMSGNLDLSESWKEGTVQWQQKGDCGLWSVTFTQDELSNEYGSDYAWIRHAPTTEWAWYGFAAYYCEMFITSVEARVPTLSEVQNGCVAIDETLPNYDTYKKIQLWTTTSISNQEDQKADYHMVKGRCEDYVLPCVTIRSKADCNDAATYLELDDTGAYALTSMNHDLDSYPGGCYFPTSGQLKYNPKLDSEMVDHSKWTRICDCRTFEKDFPFSVTAYDTEWIVSDGELVDKNTGYRFGTKDTGASDKTLLTFQADKEYATFEKLSIKYEDSHSSSHEEAVSGSNSDELTALLMDLKQHLSDEDIESFNSLLNEINNQEANDISQSESTIEQVSKGPETDSTAQQVDEIFESESTIQQVITVLQNESSVVRTMINILAFTGSLSTIYAGYAICYKRNNNYENDYENVDSGDDI